MDQPVVYGEWVELSFVIDFSANHVAVRYDGDLVVDGVWAHPNDFLPLAALNLLNWNGLLPTYGDDIWLERIAAPGDVDLDGVVDVADLVALITAWGECPGEPDPCRADFDCDGVVGVQDLLALILNWTQ